MAKYKIDFTQKYNGLKEHTAIVVSVPNSVSLAEVTDAINKISTKYPDMPMHQILDKSMGKNWTWNHLRYDAEIRMPEIGSIPAYHRRMGELKFTEKQK